MVSHFVESIFVHDELLSMEKKVYMRFVQEKNENTGGAV